MRRHPPKVFMRWLLVSIRGAPFFARIACRRCPHRHAGNGRLKQVVPRRGHLYYLPADADCTGVHLLYSLRTIRDIKRQCVGQIVGLPSVPRVSCPLADASRSYFGLLLPRGIRKSFGVKQKAGRGGGDRNHARLVFQGLTQRGSY